MRASPRPVTSCRSSCGADSVGRSETTCVRPGWTGRVSGGVETPACAPRRRPRPPRRPRRLRPGLAGAAPTPAAPGAITGADGSSGRLPCAATVPFKATTGSGGGGAAQSLSGRPGAGSDEEASSAGAEAGAAPTGMGAPRRVRASSAFVFHCARRKRSAAVVYQRTASAICPAFSCSTASSKATMASRVFSNSAASWAWGSPPALALRMRAWICRQSLMPVHCISREPLRLVEDQARNLALDTITAACI
jgi:hypothetical protein